MWAEFVTIWFWVGDQHEHTMGYLEITLLYRREYLTSLLSFFFNFATVCGSLATVYLQMQ